MKYTPEETIKLIDEYKTRYGEDNLVDNLANEFNKSPISIRAKLVHEGVYKCKQKISKITGGKPKTKEQMVLEMEQEFNFGIGELEGLEKTPKLVLMKLYRKLSDLKKLT